MFSDETDSRVLFMPLQAYNYEPLSCP